jgi:PAS domain S-box-containing protein
MGMRNVLLPRMFPVVVLPLVSLASALILMAYDFHKGREIWQSGFDRVVEERTEAIKSAHLIALAKQTTVKGLFEASEEVTESEFIRFGKNLNYPIQSLHRSLAWVPRVPASERTQFEAEQRRNHPDFSIWERGPDGRKCPASAREDYFPVTYLWIDEPDEAARGWDGGSEPIHLAALMEAMVTGKPVMTDPLQLALDVLENAPLLWGYLILTPVYSKEPPPGNAEQRRERLTGFVAGPCHYGAILENQLRLMPPAEQCIFVYASTRPDSKPVHEHLPESLGKLLPVRPEAPTYREAVAVPHGRQESLTVAEKTLVLVFTPARMPGWWEWTGRLSVMALLGGGLLTLLSVSYARQWFHKDRELREGRERLAMAVIASGQGLYDLDIPSGKVVVSPEYATMLGYDPDTYQVSPDSWIDQLHPDDRARALGVLEDMMSGKRPDYVSEYRMRTRSGQWKWLLSMGKVMQRDATGKPIRFVGSHLDATERRRTEEELRERVGQLKAILDSIPDIAWLKDLEGRYIAFNEPFVNACGRPRQELTGKTDLDIWPIELALSYRRDDQEVMERGRRKLLEERLIDSQGQEHWMETNKVPVTDDEDRVIGTTGIARDITDRRRTEQTLRDNAYFLQSLDLISEILTQRSEDSNIPDELAWALLDIFQGDRVFFVYPCAVDAPLYRVMAEANRPEYPGLLTTGEDLPFSEESARLCAKLLNHSGPVTFDFGAVGKVAEDIRRFGVLSQMAIALYPQRGQPWAMGIHQCSHRRKWTPAEQRLLQVIAERISDAFSGYLLLKQLKESEERYREAQHTAQLGHWAYDPRSERFNWWSEETFRLSGLDPARGEPSLEEFLARVHPEDRQRIADNVVHSLKTGDPFTVEYRIPLPDGATRFLEGRSVAHLGPENRVVHFSGTVMDVTERRRREQELQQKTDELIRFNYAVSHDLKSPLVTIRTFLGYLELDMRNQDSERIAKDLGFMRSASEKMSRLIDELLELSRIGRMVNVPVDVSLQELMHEAQTLVAGRLAEGGVTVRVTPVPVVIHGDRQRLVEVFQNLLDNAVKFMGNEAHPAIHVGVEEIGDELVLFVRDNGAGIDPRHQHKLFGLFEKLDPEAEGTGVGLALVKRIIEVHGGRIWAESEGLGEGATFRIILPGTRYRV